MTRVSNAQDDWQGWIDFNTKVGEKVQTVGDDLTVTNIKRIKTAAERGACNALLLKVCYSSIKNISCTVCYSVSGCFASAWREFFSVVIIVFTLI